ncbi:CD109 antigen [Trichonephila clavipes]|nr:CD109 antigen [Trichonephila clavipes]
MSNDVRPRPVHGRRSSKVASRHRSKFPVFRRIQSKKTFDHLNYSDPDLLKSRGVQHAGRMLPVSTWLVMILRLLLLWCLRTTSAQDYSTNQILKIKHEPTHFISASRTVRPGQVYAVSVTVFKSSLSVRASVQREGVELASAQQECRPRVPETLLLRIPPTSLPGSYRLRVEGGIQGVLGGSAFHNESELLYSQRSMTIFIQTNQPIYRQGQRIRFRAIPVTTGLRAFSEAVDVFILDPRGTVMRRWLSRQTNLGAVSLQYQLSQQPMFGNWTIRVIAQGQIEEKTIYVEEYYQTPFEVNVTLPAFVLENERHIRCSITANYTSGAPVTGNLTLKARLEPLYPQFRQYGQVPEIKHFVNYVRSFYLFIFLHEWQCLIGLE